MAARASKQRCGTLALKAAMTAEEYAVFRRIRRGYSEFPELYKDEAAILKRLVARNLLKRDQRFRGFFSWGPLAWQIFNSAEDA